MTRTRFAGVAIGFVSLLLATLPAGAADPAKAAKAKPAAKAPAVVYNVPDATPEQVQAAELVYYGLYDCEFKKTVTIVQSPKHSAYVEVTHGKTTWLMKPVLSSTGAIRLEDVRNEALMVQIASKSMLLDTVRGQRVVDDCISPRQRELMEAAKAKAAELAAARAAAESASAPAAAASGLLTAPSAAHLEPGRS